MAIYTIDPKASRLVVTARSSVHNTDTSFVGITGSITANPRGMSETTAAIEVDMRTADAGDWLKNRKLRKDMDFEKNPSASFKLTGVTDISEAGDRVTATVTGELTWRGKTIAIEAKGDGTIGEGELVATGRFDLDVTKLGITPPKVLMIKVDNVVSCAITLRATV